MKQRMSCCEMGWMVVGVGFLAWVLVAGLCQFVEHGLPFIFGPWLHQADVQQLQQRLAVINKELHPSVHCSFGEGGVVCGPSKSSFVTFADLDARLHHGKR